MGSTDSAGDSHHSGASSCGLVSSLFPNSCRGRAEAFARRLRRRLTSLGSVDINNSDENDGILYNETDSLSPVLDTARLQSSNHKIQFDHLSVSSCNQVLEHQPRHNSGTELSYDYGILKSQTDDAGTGIESPAEVVSPSELAHLLVNPSEDIKLNHYENDENHDSESGYIFSSPLDASPSNNSSNEAYFDPESSEGDKTNMEDFYDPVHLSESDAACDMTYDDQKSDCQKLPGRRRIDLHIDKGVETSESSSSINGHIVNELETISKKTLPCSSEESLNDVACSSLDTTSPSHESLWSTFDDSTVSQDANPSISTLSANDNVPHVTRSYTDSEFILTNLHITPISSETPSSTDETDFRNDSVCKNGESQLNTPNHPADDKLELVEDSSPTYSSSIDIPGELVVECVIVASQTIVEEVLNTEMILNTSQNSDDAVDTPELLQRLSCSPRGSFDKEIEENGKTSVDNITENSDEMDNEIKDDEEEQEIQRPQRLRRCSSLKTGKTPPGTPGRKKIVRFADVLGLDLADVRTFLDEIPKVPNSAFSDLVYDEIFRKESSPNFSDCNYFNGSPLDTTLTPKFNGLGAKPDRVLVPLFQQPGGLPNYLDLIRDRNVCLENVIVQDVVAMCIQGTVRVRNLDFHKSVHIRYTLDSWKNFSDLQACYVKNSCDGFSDKFSFQLYCHTLKVGNKLELAVRYQCKGAQYWDNNGGTNYCFQCLPMAPVVDYIPITSLNAGSTRDWSPTFY